MGSRRADGGVPAGSRARCEDECAKNTMPRLPVLTAANARTEARWHRYIQNIYHQEMAGEDTVDLNTFSWFYESEEAVQHLLNTTPCLRVCSIDVQGMVYEGTLWTGTTGPENVKTMGGVFVARPFLLPSSIPSCITLEVTHRSNQDWTGAEVGVSWFFHTVGSGVFLNCHQLPRSSRSSSSSSRGEERRRIVAFRTRSDIVAALGSWPETEGGVGMTNFMDDHDLSMLVITEADYSIQRGVGHNPRTEIVVRQNQNAPISDWYGGHTEDDAPHRSCLSDEPFGMAGTFTTGLTGTRPCVCVPSDRLNCDGSS